MSRMLLSIWITLLLIFSPACASRTPTGPQTIEYSRIVDLSHVLSADMPRTPDASSTRVILVDNVTAVELSLEHGTYLSVPAQTSRYRSTESLSPRELIVPAVVIDVRDLVQDHPTYLLSSEQIKAWEWQHGRIPAGSIVLLATGWDRRWNHPGDYLNLDMYQQPQVPGFSADAAALLLQKRHVAGLGSDTPSIDGTVTMDRPGTQAQAAGRLVIQNLTGLDQLPATGTTLFIGALKIQAGEGSPVQVLAFVP